MLIIDGKEVARRVREEVKQEIEKGGMTPRLDVILVGENPASKVYVRMKEKTCKECGIKSVRHDLPESVSMEELLELIDELNRNKEVNGILVQLPLPEHLDEQRVLEAIDPKKDVDGFHPINMGKLVLGMDCLEPCTPAGIMKLLEPFELKGKEAVVVGRSNIVGKPVAIMLLKKNCTVTVCHSKTVNLEEHTRRADILVVAVGKPKIVKADMVREGAIVVDVGINRVEGKLVGDVDFDAVKEKVKAITPVPGGVGPMTVAMLMKNTLKAYRMQNI
ncbi:MAG: bifunctional methylenetetrahydrofolate dehydrogenase/methenyltetrahydrofolate cyclohydrolase FolD [Candidatus Diapherotrites archaeon]|nr:bifunctional methylenetetrahydrofolate dehydrogenase/methenyltetrahydrofolate cyclohydrolase FolD [Candidatus Diapherotrites archaeon]